MWHYSFTFFFKSPDTQERINFLRVLQWTKTLPHTFFLSLLKIPREHDITERATMERGERPAESHRSTKGEKRTR